MNTKEEDKVTEVKNRTNLLRYRATFKTYMDNFRIQIGTHNQLERLFHLFVRHVPLFHEVRHQILTRILRKKATALPEPDDEE